MGFSHQDILKTIPKHLHQFIEEQDYVSYTSRDHAVWRHIMKKLVPHLRDRAHEVYQEGLERTGISTDHIPSIEEMNKCLSNLGWRAVVVNGFIPPAAFMEFHSYKILPIAQDMRSIEHIEYTPSPDIIHEAAGHAPFIVDIDYGEYLQRFGEYGLKALYTKKDLEMYEAIRKLSIVKECPDSKESEIKDAERNVTEKVAANTEPSEAALLSRLFWWTAEYGLVGTADDYKIFGAGLLSSLGESQSCLKDNVKKIPLTLDCLNYSYDITKAQPQLFVTRSCKHMTQVLEELADHMCFRVGGAESVQKAIKAEIVATCEYSSGLQVSGVVKTMMTNSVGREIYLGTEGPTQLSYNYKQLQGHGKDYHGAGFGSPVGGLQDITKPLENLSADRLKAIGLYTGERVSLNFLSGITVTGVLEKIWREDGKNILFTFNDCIVTTLEGEILFNPEWGKYDMAVGKRIVSVFAGSADRSEYETYPDKSERKVIKKESDAIQSELYSIYSKVRQYRNQGGVSKQVINDLLAGVQEKFFDEWLLLEEIEELINDI